MAGFDGAHVLVMVDMAAEGATEPSYQVVAAQTGFSHETSREMLDGSVKGTDHAESSYGRQESSASMDGLVSFADGTQERLRRAITAREIIVLRYSVGDAATGTDEIIYEAPALVSTISSEYPDNENSSFSAEFNLNAAWQEIVLEP